MLRCKGYTGHVEFDGEAGLFHGEVIDLLDVITFQGTSVEELERAFQDSVNNLPGVLREARRRARQTFLGTVHAPAVAAPAPRGVHARQTRRQEPEPVDLGAVGAGGLDGRGPSMQTRSSSMTTTEEISYTRFMNAEYTAVLKQDGDWWIGWIEEIPGVNCQERTKADLLESLREVLAEAIEFNRQEARNAAGEQFMEERLAL
jgi:predicted RNase H-like HicB family nuclease